MGWNQLMIAMNDGETSYFEPCISFNQKPMKVGKMADSSALNEAMIEAKKLLSSRNSSTTGGELPSCLVPDKAKTKALALAAMKSQSVFLPFSKDPNTKHKSYSRLPLPVLNMGMPKCGSSTLYEFFGCIGFSATHWNYGTETFEALCMRDAANAGLPVLSTCAHGTDALTQLDITYPFGFERDFASKQKQQLSQAHFLSNKLRDDCFFPQLSLLEEIHAESPDATFVLNFRPVEDWARSIQNWGDMMPRFQACDLPNLPRGYPEDLTNKEEVQEIMMLWFCSHVVNLRNFVKAHPSHALVEIDLYDTDLSKRMMSIFFPSKQEGKSKQCWGHSNKSKKKQS